jgi:hypothetical protein
MAPNTAPVHVLATCPIQDSTKPPVVTAGKLLPDVLRQWEVACLVYFMHKKVEKGEQVSRVAWGLQDPLMQIWYLEDRERIDKLTFNAFILEVRNSWLKPGWEDDLRQDLHSSRMANDTFWDWSIKFQSMNALLRDTDSHMTNAQMRTHMDANMHPNLQKDCNERKKELLPITNFKLWVNAVNEIDEKRQRKRTEWLEEMLAYGSRSSSSSSRNANSNNNRSRSALAPSSSQNVFTTSAPTGLPRLTAEERQILMKHQGCFKCRVPYSNHVQANCTTGAPDAATYKNLTEAAAAALRPKPAKPIAVIETAGHVEAIAAVLPSSVLGDSTDSDEYAPFSTPHFTWDCLIDSPSLSEPLPETSLIDHGSHLVLIRADLVASLGLKKRSLVRPVSVGLAMGGEKVVTELKEWVRLKVSSPDHLWCSKPVRAIVAPDLCHSLILGGPFLAHNKIVVDHAARTVIDKTSGYDLLNPPSPPKPIHPKHYVNRREEHERVKRARKTMLKELKITTKLLRPDIDAHTPELAPVDPIAFIKVRIEQLALQQRLEALDSKVKAKNIDRFPDKLPPVHTLPTDVYHRIRLKDPEKIIKTRVYGCPRKYRDAWSVLLQQHLDSGAIRPSSSAHASPSFIVPKSDPTVLPRWVNDYRELNSNTIPDNFPLPRVDDILADCAKGKIWGKIDMTNSFFQTRLHPDDIHLTASTTPFGLYEWTVMPMGGRNAPSTHQRRMTAALRKYIGKFCHVYLDDIIVWSQTEEEHEANWELVFQALRKAFLFCNKKKSTLFCTEINFLGHHISERGIEPDGSKIQRILDWPQPKCAKDVRAFLGLVRYLAAFLPNLAEYTRHLTPLTEKMADKQFPTWTSDHQMAFNHIKALVTHPDCLTVIDHENMEGQQIFVTTDASDFGVGAVLSVGSTWETSRPVAFDSMQLHGTQLNYPVHEKELFTIIRALKKWRMDLLGMPFTVYTDHRSLENFDTQRDLSRCQARWAKFLAQYDMTIKYIPGELNLAADALSRLPPLVSLPTDDDDEPESQPIVAAVLALAELPDMPPTPSHPIASLSSSFQITSDPQILHSIRAAYTNDPFCKKLSSVECSIKNVVFKDGLWFINNHLVIPAASGFREILFRLCHDTLGHFGTSKCYATLRDAYYWPNMRRDLDEAYIPGCVDCQRNKSRVSKPTGPLHPLPIPETCGDSVAIDFIGPLPEDDGFNAIVTMTDRSGADIRIAPTRLNYTADQFALQFYNVWFCENGLPLHIVGDHDKLFLSKFWKSLTKLTGIILKMSSSYHPETDGSSERSNKTVDQALRYHVERNQRGWV